jgi:3-dehydroquinate synthase
MVLAAALSERVTGLAPQEAERLRALIERAGLRRRAPSMRLDRWLEVMARDKKTAERRLRFVLLSALGVGVARCEVDERELEAVLAAG